MAAVTAIPRRKCCAHTELLLLCVKVIAKVLVIDCTPVEQVWLYQLDYFGNDFQKLLIGLRSQTYLFDPAVPYVKMLQRPAMSCPLLLCNYQLLQKPNRLTD